MSRSCSFGVFFITRLILWPGKNSLNFLIKKPLSIDLFKIATDDQLALRIVQWSLPVLLWPTKAVGPTVFRVYKVYKLSKHIYRRRLSQFHGIDFSDFKSTCRWDWQLFPKVRARNRQKMILVISNFGIRRIKITKLFNWTLSLGFPQFKHITGCGRF